MRIMVSLYKIADESLVLGVKEAHENETGWNPVCLIQTIEISTSLISVSTVRV